DGKQAPRPPSRKDSRIKPAPSTRIQPQLPEQGAPTPAVRTRARLVLEKLPLFALIVVSAAVTYRAPLEQSAVGTLIQFPLPVRIKNAVVGYATYVEKTFWPADLAVYYPHPIYGSRADSNPTLDLIGGATLVLVLVLVALSSWRRRVPYVLTG